ncbi:hypothetical protein LJK88_13445 [Paenibacillus sp. P26]|nr:hypothetical protein LJK88_13445 [Paenibacillus sp. P26]UUZ97913.1 hypothetical protein LJK87_24255 [Paenibacillus sp. P25]
MYILQESLFSFEELQKLEFKERMPIFFSALDLRSYAKELRSRSPEALTVTADKEFFGLCLQLRWRISVRSLACIAGWIWIFVFAINADFGLIGRLLPWQR